MTATSSLRVTFDTNTCDIVHDPNKRPEIIAPPDAEKIRTAIANGRIAGFISEATLFVECLSFEDKLTYLSVVGTKNPRPAPDRRRVAVFDDLAKLGMTLLHARLIGAENFNTSLNWAPDVIHTAMERHDRFCAFVRPLPRHEPLKAIGNKLLAGQSPLLPKRRTQTGPNSSSVEIPQGWAVALKREWDGNPAGRKALQKQVGLLIEEWCDGLIVGSHVGYSNDIFCTADQGMKAGARSLLHHSNRANLQAQGIVIMSPTDLVKYLGL